MIGRLHTVVIDCPDPQALAEFYGELLGGKITHIDEDWVTLGIENGPPLSFQLAPDLQPPRWPDPGHPQQFHLDVSVEDVDAAESKVLALGATHLHTPEDQDFRVYADPAGHPFCLVF
jgi:catechol 2,3-dioxygenase-like lactoylglutathione lyase family enzyme